MEDQKKSKYDIPLVIVDTRTERPRVIKEENTALRKAETSQSDILPTLELLIKKLWQIIQKPLIALKFRFFRTLDKFFDDVEVPWIKVIAIGLIAFMVFRKNISFNFSFNAPFASSAAVGEDQSARARTTTFGAGDANPYAPVAAKTLHEKQSNAFIKKYLSIAKEEMKTFNIPASIKMAQALIESRAGHSYLAKNNNNHFGIKCFSKKCKKGHCTNATDDHHKDFFRSFKSPKESWRAHSNLISRGRYKHLQQYGKDYKKWAHGLKKAGYATDKRYAEKLINTINKYQLYKLD